MSKSPNQSGLLPEATAQMRIEAWQKASFDSLLDRFHDSPTLGKYGRYQNLRLHTFVLGAEDAAALIDPNNTDIARLRVYLSLDVPSDNSPNGKFAFIIQGRKAIGNSEVYYTGCYQATPSSKLLDPEQGGGLPFNSQATTIPFSLGRLYVDDWNQCDNRDLIAAFHAPIHNATTKITESERAAHYTYSVDDIVGLKAILMDNPDLYISNLIFYLGSGDPNPEYGHPFSFRPVMRAIFQVRSESGKTVPEIGISVPPSVRFNTFDGGNGGSVTLDFAHPCPPICNND